MRSLKLQVILGLVSILRLSAAENLDSYGILEGTVLDAATRKPMPCTLTIVDSMGKTLVENRSFQAGFRSDGHFIKELPPGETRLRVTRGFEYRAMDQIVQVPTNGRVQATFLMERVVDLRKLGWYAGDSHAHMNHGEKTLPVDFDFVALTARAEDLHYLSLAQSWSLDDPTPERLEQELAPRSTPDCFSSPGNLESS